MRNALLILFAFIFHLSSSQCPPTSANVVFNSQQDINDYFTNYPGCTELQNVLRIEGSDITNLNGLNGITSFGGLWMVNNPLLTNLDGLNSLTNFDFTSNSIIYIENNPLLTNLNGLGNAVNDNPMDLIVKDNPQLISLNGLQGIQQVGYSIVIQNNDLLVDFSGLNGFTNMDDFVIIDNDGLTSFNGLDNLEITGSFIFENNDAMTSFTTLNNINPLCGFIIRDNNNLQDIDGFASFYMEGCEPNIYIENNPNLSLCDTNYVCSVIPSLGIFVVSNNAIGCNSTEEISLACPDCPPEGVFNSQAEIDAFATIYPNCNQFQGLLKISGNDITDLSGLSNIESVATIQIVDNLLLANLDGLENLSTLLDGFTVFDIKNNASLQNISGLSGLAGFLSHVIDISNNPVLQTLNGLEGITGTEDTCRIINNDSLEDLTGLSSFESCDDLYIEDNDMLQSIEGLAASLDTGRFYFINNEAALTLTTTSTLDPSCGIVIQDNDLIENLNGLEGIYELGCTLEIKITDNPNLSLCSNSYTCSYISNIDLDFDIIEVRDNASGCNTVFEISNGCDQAPFNDECEGGELEALVIGQSYNTSLDLATMSPNIPLCNDVSNRADIWFTFNSGNFTSLSIMAGLGISFQLWEGNCENLSAIPELCGSNQISFETPENKQYYLQIWAANNAERSIELIDDFQILVTNGFLSQDNFNTVGFELYPNPFNNEVYVSAYINIESCYIYNIQGKLLEIIEINATKATLNLSEFESGIYFVKFVNGDSAITRKIIKQ